MAKPVGNFQYQAHMLWTLTATAN